MKIRIMTVVLAAAMVMLASCGGKDNDLNSKESGASAGSSLESSTQESSDGGSQDVASKGDESRVSAESISIKKGLWWAVGEDDDTYYYFEDSESGTLIYQSTGNGVGFSYEIKYDDIEMHLGNSESSIKAKVVSESDDELEFKFNDGKSEKLSYQGEMNLDIFTFYNNDELCQMALGYYEMKNGSRPEKAAAEIDDTGMIKIQLYDESDGHNSNADFYTVDRFTGKGFNSADEQIDLTEVPMG